MTGTHRPDPARVPAPRRGDHDTTTSSDTAPGRALVFSPARLRAWRHARNLDHAALADVAGCSAGQVRACESGQADPTSGMIAAWAALLGCRPDQLCSATPTDPAEYWDAANQAMPRMSAEDLAVVARVFTRITDRTTGRAAG